MTTETNYIFVKGDGWIPEPQRMITMKCGKRVKLEFRRPEIGEMYDYTDLSSTRYFVDNQPLWETWIRGFQESDFDNCCGPWSQEHTFYDDYGYIVAVPV